MGGARGDVSSKRVRRAVPEFFGTAELVLPSKFDGASINAEKSVVFAGPRKGE